MTTTTSTGHTLTVDTDAMLLRIGGDIDTMDRIPETEIDAACAAAGVRCTYDAADSDAYRVVSLDTLARGLASEVSARWPSLDHGDGVLYVIARNAIDEDVSVTAERVAEIAREAEEEASAD